MKVQQRIRQIAITNGVMSPNQLAIRLGINYRTAKSLWFNEDHLPTQDGFNAICSEFKIEPGKVLMLVDEKGNPVEFPCDPSKEFAAMKSFVNSID